MKQSIKEMDFSLPAIMGILNVTPDSFFDGGKHQKKENALLHAKKMYEEGATWIDIGGESTRPGAKDVSISEELDRVLPIVEMVAKELDVLVSIDTSKAEVMEEAIKLGASMVNDVYALHKKDTKETVAKYNVNVCLMHMQGQPKSMQQSYSYNDVTKDVKIWLKARMKECEQAGIAKNKITIDPGIGFGKSDLHNLQLVKEVEEFFELDVPVMLGMSRKSTIGRVLNRTLQDRLEGSLALATIAAMKGVHILRVHDVKETLDAIKMVKAVNNN